MNKLPKEIYVVEETENHIFYIDPKEPAMPDRTRVLGVYKLVGKVEVSTETRQEIVVKKSPALKKQKAKQDAPEPDPEPFELIGRNPLLDEMRVTSS